MSQCEIFGNMILFIEKEVIFLKNMVLHIHIITKHYITKVNNISREITVILLGIHFTKLNEITERYQIVSIG